MKGWCLGAECNKKRETKRAGTRSSEHGGPRPPTLPRRPPAAPLVQRSAFRCASGSIKLSHEPVLASKQGASCIVAVSDP